MNAFSTVIASARKRRGEGHTRREEILHAAKELFLEQGYDATTIRRIADRVGISAPALYLYFQDKDALMLALCDQTFGHLIEAIGEIENALMRKSRVGFEAEVKRNLRLLERFGLDPRRPYGIPLAILEQGPLVDEKINIQRIERHDRREQRVAAAGIDQIPLHEVRATDFSLDRRGDLG